MLSRTTRAPAATMAVALLTAVAIALYPQAAAGDDGCPGGSGGPGPSTLHGWYDGHRDGDNGACPTAVPVPPVAAGALSPPAAATPDPGQMAGAVPPAAPPVVSRPATPGPGATPAVRTAPSRLAVRAGPNGAAGPPVVLALLIAAGLVSLTVAGLRARRWVGAGLDAGWPSE